MSFIKVLGIGSPFGDDQAGWEVAEALKRQLAACTAISAHVHIERIDHPGIRLVELLRTSDTVFLIDAVRSNSTLGTIHQFTNEDIVDSAPKFSTHNIGVLQALQIASALNELPNHLLFYGIEINTITLDTILSEEVKSAIARLTIQLKNEIIEKLIHGHSLNEN
ncbi:hydrogenase maturation protease [Legionella longbeachae]|uniref:Hydrogenase expression/formation protein n=1 Tax=Legionella longbeachae serogroup 1 (strain NSW150) TaxID=661367 RepID=D3HKA8_LEGLN|nr:hydrogenase maturation protease [Legionella longbeachae]VEE03388.1 hydrogenase expression/formation protein [Legionella oakridgensis]HBD7397664.1 hydrogenase maturation protease [Legionella pneumophila]ARB93718.1 hydrogenase [Legionella longbeachae]ARM33142.1 hydrogenase maturation protease [Legionella longbeachae]EEZ94010.1 hydrogenase maturation protease [Legionella longbeachae D-4968]